MLFYIFTEVEANSGSFTDSGATYTGNAEDAVQFAIDAQFTDGLRRALLPYEPITRDARPPIDPEAYRPNVTPTPPPTGGDTSDGGGGETTMGARSAAAPARAAKPPFNP